MNFGKAGSGFKGQPLFFQEYSAGPSFLRKQESKSLGGKRSEF
jgi:hypothetical protein